MAHDDGRVDEDPLAGVDDAVLDHTLRELLTRIPDEPAGAGDLPPAALAEISHAIDVAWPDGTPPTAEQIAEEDDPSAFSGHDDRHTAVALPDDAPGHSRTHGHDTFGHGHPDSHGGHDHPDGEDHSGHVDLGGHS